MAITWELVSLTKTEDMITFAIHSTEKIVKSISSITYSNGTALVTTGTDHGLKTSQEVKIAGANESEYNGIFQVTVLSVTTFEYAVVGTPSTPATGTIVVGYQEVISYAEKFNSTEGDGDDKAKARLKGTINAARSNKTDADTIELAVKTTLDLANFETYLGT
jgi:hypothetical protein